MQHSSGKLLEADADAAEARKRRQAASERDFDLKKREVLQGLQLEEGAKIRAAVQDQVRVAANEVELIRPSRNHCHCPASNASPLTGTSLVECGESNS